MSPLDKAIEKLKDKEIKDVAIVMHHKPDGDSVGSSVALEECLRSINKRVDLIIHNKIPQRFAPIVGGHRVNRKILPPFGKKYDLLIMVDFSDPERTIEDVEELSDFIIVLDHHTSNDPYGDVYICEECSATGIVVLKVIEQLCVVTKKIANAIYMTLITDTNNFKNNKTDSQAHEVAAKLLLNGADIRLVNSMFDDKSIPFIKLMGNTFKDIKYDANYRITYLVVTRDKIKAAGASGEEVALLIDEIRWIKNSDITFLFIEGIKNVRISARSSYTPIDSVLKEFGGGGHPHAAGCAIERACINTVVQDVLKSTKNYIDNRRNKKK